MTKPLLGLAMIVKNEAHGIAETLRSIKPYIDRWTILDTGSTDDTRSVIRTEMDGVPGQLIDTLFTDFSSSRNQCLDLHGTETEWVFMPDADDVLEGGEHLRKFLQFTSPNAWPDSAYLINLVRGSLDYWLPLVMRTAHGKRYKGRVHEHLDYVATKRIDCGFFGTPYEWKVRLTQPHVKPQSHDATRKRWERDVALLEDDLKQNPKNERAMFYLAQTYECLGRKTEALQMYARRVDAGGWEDERFEAAFRRAKLKKAMKIDGWHTSMLAAHDIDPRRAEPLYELAEDHRQKDQHAMAYLYGSRAASMPKPETLMWVDPDVYRYKAADVTAISAFYLHQKTRDRGVFASGKMFAEQCVRECPDDNRMRVTRAHYTSSCKELFGAKVKPIRCTPDAGYHAGNASVHFDPVDKMWRCLQRTTNYQIVNGEYLTTKDDGTLTSAAEAVIYTRNLMLELDVELDTKVQRPLVNAMVPGPATHDFPVHGYEDCRLFTMGGRMFASATVCDWEGSLGGKGQRELVLLEIGKRWNQEEANYRVIKAERLPVWESVRTENQKNWMPIQEATYWPEHRQRFVYATKPLTLTTDVDAPMGPLGRLRGGSQVIPISARGHESIRLAIVHDVCWPGGTARIYLHRFVAFTQRMDRVIAMSEPFYFQKLGIEFCAGLALGPAPADPYNPWADQLVASFSVDDSKSYFAVFDLNTVLSSLHENYLI